MYKVIGPNEKEVNTDVLLHPGEILMMEIKARNIKKSKFAMMLQIHPRHMNDILKGNRSLGDDIALKLESVLGISADFWKRLQTNYNLSLLRAKDEAMIVFSKVPEPNVTVYKSKKHL